MSDISCAVRNEGWMKTLEELDPREREIIALLERHPRGLTSWEVAACTGHLVHAVLPRFTNLESLGVVEAVGKRFYAPTKRNETVWRLSGGTVVVGNSWKGVAC